MNIQTKNSKNQINPPSNEPKNNININKIRTTISKKNPQTKKRTLKDLKSNKPLDQLYPQNNRIKSNSQINNQFGPRNSVPTNKRLIGNRISILEKLNNAWLSKYFIYRHESLNNYLFKIDFKKTLDYLADNYKKQVTSFRGYRPSIQPNINPNKIKPINNSLNSNLAINDKNIPRKNFFRTRRQFP